MKLRSDQVTGVCGHANLGQSGHIQVSKGGFDNSEQVFKDVSLKSNLFLLLDIEDPDTHNILLCSIWVRRPSVLLVIILRFHHPCLPRNHPI
jgi:hypothetical protein